MPRKKHDIPSSIEQLECRLRLKRHLKQDGVTQAFIADKLGIARQLLNDFKCISKPLWRQTLDDLSDYLEQKGYPKQKMTMQDYINILQRQKQNKEEENNGK